MLTKKNKKRVENSIVMMVCVFGAIFLFLLLAYNIVYPAILTFFSHQAMDSGQQFVYLAESFSHGHLHFTHEFGWAGEPSFYNGKSYYALGPLPAVLLVPFVFVAEKFHFFFYQGFLNAPIFFGVMFLVYKISRNIGYEKKESLLLSCASCFGSPLILSAVLPISSYFAHVVTSALVFLAFFEYFGKKRFRIIGILLGLVLLTRFTAAVGLVFFVLVILFEEKPFKQKLRNMISLALPFCLFVGLYALYNWLRFENILETGYSFQRLPYRFQTELRDTGLFALHHVKTNAYHMFLGVPLNFGKSLVPLFWNNPNGVSIFLTSMYLLYFFRIKKFSQEVRYLLFASLLILMPILLSWSTGFFEVGSRFSLDFLPFLFVALVLGVRERYGKLPQGFVVLTLLSMIFNCYILMVALAESTLK